MAKSLKNERHAHGCQRCHVRYEDACADPPTDDLCTGCRGGLVWQLLVDSAAAKDCCRTSIRMVTKDEKQTYRLAGGHLWHICSTCSRTHPTDPRRPL